MTIYGKVLLQLFITPKSLLWLVLTGKLTRGLNSVFSTKTTQQPIVYEHIIANHLLWCVYTNGYDNYCNINKKNTKKQCMLSREYVQNLFCWISNRSQSCLHSAVVKCVVLSIFWGNSLVYVRHLRSDDYSAEQVLLNNDRSMVAHLN